MNTLLINTKYSFDEKLSLVLTLSEEDRFALELFIDVLLEKNELEKIEKAQKFLSL